MLVSFVLRVAPDAVAEGGLAGQIEAVASGERGAVGSVEELLGFLRESCAADRDALFTPERSNHADPIEGGR